MKTKILAAAIFSAAISVSSSAFATYVLPLDGGWEYDQVNAVPPAVSVNSPIELIVPASGALFSLSDGFIPGDVYTVSVGFTPSASFVTVTTTFTLYPTPFVNDKGPAAGDFAADWLSTDFAHLQLDFTAGTYFLKIRDIDNQGLPAGVGERLDAVPEASTWAMLGTGFAAIGLVGLSRRRRGSRYAL